MPISIPDELIERLKFYCLNNDLGMSAIVTDHFAVVVIGSDTLSPNQIHLAAAHTLITGVLNGEWNEANTEASKEQENEEERKPS